MGVLITTSKRGVAFYRVYPKSVFAVFSAKTLSPTWQRKSGTPADKMTNILKNSIAQVHFGV